MGLGEKEKMTGSWASLPDLTTEEAVKTLLDILLSVLKDILATKRLEKPIWCMLQVVVERGSSRRPR